jgi:hypothetical protein
VFNFVMGASMLVVVGWLSVLTMHAMSESTEQPPQPMTPAVNLDTSGTSPAPRIYPALSEFHEHAVDEANESPWSKVTSPEVTPSTNGAGEEPSRPVEGSRPGTNPIRRVLMCCSNYC